MTIHTHFCSLWCLNIMLMEISPHKPEIVIRIVITIPNISIQCRLLMLLGVVIIIVIWCVISKCAIFIMILRKFLILH